jgi:acyl carrier protein
LNLFILAAVRGLFVANIQQFIGQFRTAVDFQKVVDIEPDTELANLAEWDSLAKLSVMVMFDMEYDKAISDADVKACKTIRDLFALLG